MYKLHHCNVIFGISWIQLYASARQRKRMVSYILFCLILWMIILVRAKYSAEIQMIAGKSITFVMRDLGIQIYDLRIEIRFADFSYIVLHTS